VKPLRRASGWKEGCKAACVHCERLLWPQARTLFFAALIKAREGCFRGSRRTVTGTRPLRCVALRYVCVALLLLSLLRCITHGAGPAAASPSPSESPPSSSTGWLRCLYSCFGAAGISVGFSDSSTNLDGSV
jgi:hypothetical protein